MRYRLQHVQPLLACVRLFRCAFVRIYAVHGTKRHAGRGVRVAGG